MGEFVDNWPPVAVGIARSSSQMENMRLTFTVGHMAANPWAHPDAIRNVSDYEQCLPQHFPTRSDLTDGKRMARTAAEPALFIWRNRCGLPHIHRIRFIRWSDVVRTARRSCASSRAQAGMARRRARDRWVGPISRRLARV